MVTRIPVVAVSRTERGGAYVTCDACPQLRTTFPNRPAADAFARRHIASHQTPEPTEEGDWL